MEHVTRRRLGRLAAAVVIAAALSFGAATAEAAMIDLHATLHPAAGVSSSAIGTMTGSFDPATHKLTWTVTYSGLTSPETMAHFHGPAKIGGNAGVQVPIAAVMASPMAGSATITDAQAKQLLGGLWYVNIHTQKYPAGEIRGHVMQGK